MRWLGTEQVAKKIGVSIRTVERWRVSGVLVPTIRTRGNHSRYSEEQICEFKATRELDQMMSF